jgi:hypothetical protein
MRSVYPRRVLEGIVRKAQRGGWFNALDVTTGQVWQAAHNGRLREP